MAEDSPKSGEGNQAVQADVPHLGAQSHDVFVSYASQDAGIANAVVEALEKQGIRCWIAPRDVTPGALYADGIIRAINDSKALVLILSTSSVASKHVGKEVERASSKGRLIITFKVDAAPLTTVLEYFLSESQWIEVGAGGMAAAASEMVEAVRRHLDPSLVTEPSTAVTRAKVPRARWIVVGAVVAVSLALAYFAVEKMWLPRRIAEEKPAAAAVSAAVPAPLAIPEKSVAVLPFVDMSEKKDQEYFSDGMSEELISLLAKLSDLRVPARTSAFYFKGKQVAIADIARALSVAYVLEGSVRKSGKTLRVTAQLIRVNNGFHVWSETYDRQLDDIFKVQDEIANSVVLALVGSLHEDITAHSSNEFARPLTSATVSQPPVAPSVSSLAHEETVALPIAGHGLTQNSDAYTLYLQARSRFQRGTKDNPKTGKADYEAAAGYLKQALLLDPSFAAAWAEVAKIRVRQVMAHGLTIRQAREEAHHSAERALALDPRLAAVYMSIGSVYWAFDWNWLAAETEFNKAIELEPGNADGFRWAARAASTLGHFDEALIRVRKAIELDPLEVLNYKMLGDIYYRAGRYAQAETAWSTGRALNPSYFEEESSARALTLLARGEAKAALEARARSPRSNWDNWYRSIAYHALGRHVESDAALARFEKLEANDSAVDVPEIHSYRGELDQALTWLNRAYEQRDESLAFIKGDPFLRNLERDARYEAFLRKMRLPD
jgi:TolB-like protein/tetratricopeptide (TPR) repeat protein